MMTSKFGKNTLDLPYSYLHYVKSGGYRGLCVLLSSRRLGISGTTIVTYVTDQLSKHDGNNNYGKSFTITSDIRYRE